MISVNLLIYKTLIPGHIQTYVFYPYIYQSLLL